MSSILGNTSFDNGYILSGNIRFIVGVISILLAISVIGLIFMPITLFFLFAKNNTKVDFGKREIIQSVHLFTFNIRSKSILLTDYIYISVIPTKTTQTGQSRSGMVASSTDYFSSVTLYKNKLKGAVEIKKFTSKKEADQIALQLSEQLNLDYFSYSPKKIRQMMTEG